MSHKIDWKTQFNISIKDFDQKKSIQGFKIIDSLFIVDKDSLRTHPFIKNRIKSIGYESEKKIKTAKKQSFTVNQLKVFHSFIETSKEQKFILLNFYLNNMLHSLYPDEPYYSNNISELIDEIYTLKKRHELGKYVGFRNKKEEKTYLNEIRNFITNSELYQLKQIKNYLKSKL